MAKKKRKEPPLSIKFSRTAAKHVSNSEALDCAKAMIEMSKLGKLLSPGSLFKDDVEFFAQLTRNGNGWCVNIGTEQELSKG
jgi:hypothetical protein